MTTDLFPVPSHTRTAPSPRVWPGATPASAAALLDGLKDNHKRWHVFFNNMRFHNHSAHHILALWALGADEEIIKAAYEEDCKEQRPAFESPEPITDDNWTTHLGDEQYYQAYLKFFTEKVNAKGMDAVLEEYIFGVSANYAAGKEVQPAMLNRFLGGLLHPMIHAGHGYEFELPGMAVEGFAQAAVHEDGSQNLLPGSMFAPLAGGDGLASRFAKAIGLATKDEKPKAPVHALTVLARILADQRFETEKPITEFGIYRGAVDKHGDALREYVDQWTLDGAIEEKVEELAWANVLIYGVGGWEGPEKPLNADFFHMHFVTSSIFLSSLVAHLSRNSQELLLRTYFTVVLAWYIGHGRAPIDIDAFFADKAREYPTPPGPLPTPHKDANPSPTSPKATTPNAWLATIQTTLVHPDDHVPKIQRALAHYGELYGGRQAGHFAGVELKGADKLDGTLFLRVSGLTTERTGWIREGERPGDGTWDRRGFYKVAVDAPL